MKQLRLRAEAMLIDLRCANDGGVRFAEAAKQWSNCPSGQQGGDLGWLTRADCAPEFAGKCSAVPKLVCSHGWCIARFGLHVVEVVAREAGQQPSFEGCGRQLVLRQQAWVNALRQYLQLLAGAAVVEGNWCWTRRIRRWFSSFQGYGRMSCRMSCSIACVGSMTMLSPNTASSSRTWWTRGSIPPRFSSAALTPDWFLTC